MRGYNVRGYNGTKSSNGRVLANGKSAFSQRPCYELQRLSDR